MLKNRNWRRSHSPASARVLAGLRSWSRTGAAEGSQFCQEGRVKRIHAKRAERQQQWAAWEQELRRTFAKERARYAAALARLDGELKDAMKQQAEARLVLRDVLQARSIKSQQSLRTWQDALMSGVPDPWDAETSQDAVLRRGLQ